MREQNTPILKSEEHVAIKKWQVCFSDGHKCLLLAVRHYIDAFTIKGPEGEELTVLTNQDVTSLVETEISLKQVGLCDDCRALCHRALRKSASCLLPALQLLSRHCILAEDHALIPLGPRMQHKVAASRACQLGAARPKLYAKKGDIPGALPSPVWHQVWLHEAKGTGVCSQGEVA
eukprot:1137379-Pelagomonas_calceolata.AAC.12